jgi:hypothetical protein
MKKTLEELARKVIKEKIEIEKLRDPKSETDKILAWAVVDGVNLEFLWSEKDGIDMFSVDENIDVQCYQTQNRIICPYCFKGQSDISELVGIEDGAISEIQCEHCEETFWVQQSIKYLYDSYKTSKST